MNLRTSAAILLLTGLATLTFWLGTEPADKAESARDVAEGPDFFMDRFSMLLTDEAGRPEYHISGTRMERLRADGRSEIVSPSVAFHGAGGPAWQMDAAEARLSPDGREILLTGDVVIDRPEGEAGRANRLTTDHLTLWTDTRMARTDAPVHMTEGPQRLDATGMQADMQARTIEFHSKVRTVYVR